MALTLVVALVVGCTQASPKPPEANPRTLTGNIGAAAYEIDVPSGWNGTLFLYSHGYVAPGGTSFAAAAPSLDSKAWLLSRHYAIAGSSYSSAGWALPDAFTDQIAVLDYFAQHVSGPNA